MSFAKNLKARREALGLSKAELGRLAGVTDVTIGYWENETITGVTHTNLLNLAWVLKTSVSELIDERQFMEAKARETNQA
jgi:transcriptional regulator with XRE-family HTH domain